MRSQSTSFMCSLIACMIAGLSVATPARAGFTTIINAPPTVISSGASVGPDTQLNVFAGGVVGSLVEIGNNSEIDVYGGSVGDNLQLTNGSVGNLIGGSVDNGLTVYPSAIANISGGMVGGQIFANSGGQIHLMGTAFYLDGVLLDSLMIGVPFTIVDRDVTLSGMLEDGSAISFPLNANFSQSGQIPPGATVTVTLVPEPGMALLCALGMMIVWRRTPALAQSRVIRPA